MAEALKIKKRKQRKNRIRAKVKGTRDCPRLSVFRSNKYIYLQLIDDQAGQTLVFANDQELKSKIKQTKKQKAFAVGELLAEKALKAKIKKVVFDRAGYRYHGRVKAAAEGAREKGLKF